MVDGYTLHNVLDKIKRIGIKKLENIVDTSDKLPYDIAINNAVILMIRVIKGGDKFYLQQYLEEALNVE